MIKPDDDTGDDTGDVTNGNDDGDHVISVIYT